MASESPTHDEVEVAEILLHLPEMILSRAFNSQVVFAWGRRRKRSDPREENYKAFVVSQPPPPPTQPLEVMAEATSPATPLSFSSDSDSMGNGSKRKSHHHGRNKKKRKVEWLHHLAELTQQKTLLQTEIQNVRAYYGKLNNFNSLLRARKEELMTKPDSKKGQISSLDSHRHHHNQALSEDRTVQIRSSDRNPNVLLDLNVVPFEPCDDVDAFQPSDSAISEREGSRLRAREARHKRIQINRGKNFFPANNKHRSPKS